MTLSPDIEKRLEELVERGEYPSADAMVNDTLGSFLVGQRLVSRNLHALSAR